MKSAPVAVGAVVVVAALVAVLSLQSSSPNALQPPSPGAAASANAAKPNNPGGNVSLRGRVLRGRDGLPDVDIEVCRKVLAQTTTKCDGEPIRGRTDATGAYVVEVPAGPYQAVIANVGDLDRVLAWAALETKEVNGPTFEAPTIRVATHDIRVIKPAVGETVTDPRPTFEWTPIPHTARYKLWVAPADSMKPIIDVDVTETKFRAESALTPNTSHLWLVTAFDDQGTRIADSLRPTESAPAFVSAKR